MVVVGGTVVVVLVVVVVVGAGVVGTSTVVAGTSSPTPVVELELSLAVAVPSTDPGTVGSTVGSSSAPRYAQLLANNANTAVAPMRAIRRRRGV